MRLLIVGAGGVGTAVAKTIAKWNLFGEVVVADALGDRAARAIAGAGPRFSSATVDASNERALTDLMVASGTTVVLNALDPRFVMPVFNAAFAAHATYLDMAMSLSTPHPTDPYHSTGRMLGDDQFAKSQAWEDHGLLALCGMGIEPGMSDVFARYAADSLFSTIDEIGVRDGANLAVAGYDFAPTFSIWTTIEECLNPPVIYERDRGWFTTPPFSEPETFVFPGGIGPVECVNVEHEEVLLIPRWIDCNRVTFKYGLGDEFIQVLSTLHKLGLDSTSPVSVGGTKVAPRDLVAACLPNPAEIGDLITGVTCAGTWITGTGVDGAPREVYLYHLTDNEWTMREFDSQAVVWQTALNPIVALELLDSGAWEGSGVLGPEALPARPFLDLVNAHGAPWGIEERTVRSA